MKKHFGKEDEKELDSKFLCLKLSYLEWHNLNSELTDNNVYLSDSRGARRPEYAKAKDES